MNLSLDESDNKVTLVTQNGRIEVDTKVVKFSPLLTTLLETNTNNELIMDDKENPIDIDLLKDLMRYCEYHAENGYKVENRKDEFYCSMAWERDENDKEIKNPEYQKFIDYLEKELEFPKDKLPQAITRPISSNKFKDLVEPWDFTFINKMVKKYLKNKNYDVYSYDSDGKPTRPPNHIPFTTVLDNLNILTLIDVFAAKIGTMLRNKEAPFEKGYLMSDEEVKADL